MLFLAKTSETIEHFKEHYYDEIFRSMYKYFTEIRFSYLDFEAYIEYFRCCEKLGFSYFLYLSDEDEEGRKIVCFSTFMIKDIGNSLNLDLTYYKNNTAEEYFSELFKEAGYFLISSDTSENYDCDSDLLSKNTESADSFRNKSENTHLRRIK